MRGRDTLRTGSFRASGSRDHEHRPALAASALTFLPVSPRSGPGHSGFSAGSRLKMSAKRSSFSDRHTALVFSAGAASHC